MQIEYGTLSMGGHFVPLTGPEDYARKTAVEIHRMGGEVYWRQVTMAEQVTDWEADCMEEWVEGYEAGM